jgi:hypothetical protein
MNNSIELPILLSKQNQLNCTVELINSTINDYQTLSDDYLITQEEDLDAIMINSPA